MDKDSLLRSTGKFHLEDLCGCLTQNLKNAPFPFVHRGNTVPQHPTLLKLMFRRPLLLLILVRYSQRKERITLLSVMGMAGFIECWDYTRCPCDLPWSTCLRAEETGQCMTKKMAICLGIA